MLYSNDAEASLRINTFETINNFLPSNSSITPTNSAHSLDFIFDTKLTFSKQISSLSMACNYYVRNLHHIRHTLDLKTASIIAISPVHSKLDYLAQPI